MSIDNGKLVSHKCNSQELESMILELRSRVEGCKIPGGIVPRTDTEFLARFIRVKDNNVGAALKSILKYYDCIHRHRDYHANIRPSKCAYAYDSKAYLVLKHRFEGVFVAVGRIKYWNPKELPLVDGQRACTLAAEQYLNQVELQERGVSVIYDLEGLRIEQLWHITIKEMRRCAEIALEGMPARVVSIHILNAPKIFWPVYHIGKRFIKEKIQKRIHFHENLESLHSFFDMKKLPECLGGELSEEDACETHVIEQLIKEDIPYEEYWNGAIWRAKSGRRCSSARSMDLSRFG